MRLKSYFQHRPSQKKDEDDEEPLDLGDPSLADPTPFRDVFHGSIWSMSLNIGDTHNVFFLCE